MENGSSSLQSIFLPLLTPDWKKDGVFGVFWCFLPYHKLKFTLPPPHSSLSLPHYATVQAHLAPHKVKFISKFKLTTVPTRSISSSNLQVQVHISTTLPFQNKFFTSLLIAFTSLHERDVNTTYTKCYTEVEAGNYHWPMLEKVDFFLGAL